MKHLKRVTKQSPLQTPLLGSICKFATQSNNFLSFIGASFDLTGYIEDKCNLPEDYFD